MKREQIKAEKRELLGKKVKKLRKEGYLPANVFGKNFDSAAIQVKTIDFIPVFKKAGETGIVDLLFEGKTIPTLIHNVQIDPKTQTALHCDFFKVNLKEKITARIPVIAAGVAPAVKDNLGVLMQPLGEVEVEALPTDLPEHIEVNVEALAQVGDQIIAEQLQIPENVTLLTDTQQVIFKIGELVTPEAEEQATEEAEAAEEAAEEGQEAQEGTEETPSEEEQTPEAAPQE